MQSLDWGWWREIVWSRRKSGLLERVEGSFESGEREWAVLREGWEHLRLSASPQAVWSSYWPPLRLLAPLCFLESLFKWASRKSSKCMWHWLKGTRISCRKPFESENATIGSEVPTCLIFDSELLRIVSRLFICWTVHNVHPKYQRFISLTPKLTRQPQLQHSTEDRAYVSQGSVG